MRFPFVRNSGILGLNARNLLYVKPFNPRKAVAFADDKMKTKAFLSARGIPTAKLFARIDTRRQLASFDFSSLPDECVLKPNYGFGGEGIIILKGRKNGVFLDQGKTPIEESALREHIEDIIDGKYSINGRADSAFFEQILVADDCFVPFRPAGLPDIRIIVFNLVPVMAMLRIPTSVSGGKANVHLGGIGIGIDIAKGVTTYAAQYHGMIQELSHGTAVSGLQIPNWENLLLIASKIQYITNIGYLAVDITIDRDMGPVLLEVNARAGLMVQVANLSPLRSRLERVEGLSVSTPEKGVRLAQELFGEKVPETSMKQTTKKPILGSEETIEIAGDGFTVEEPCLIATDREETTFDSSLVRELIHGNAIEAVDGSSGSYRVKFSLANKKIQTIAREGTLSGTRVYVGRRDLTGFLIDPAKKRLKQVPLSRMKKDLHGIDHMLSTIDKELSILKYVRPINLDEEIARAEDDVNYNPIFLYRQLPRETTEMREALVKMRMDDTPMGLLLEKKRHELLSKITLLTSRGQGPELTTISEELYGDASEDLIRDAMSYIAMEDAAEESEISTQDEISSRDVQKRFERVLSDYGLHDWQVVIRKGMVADCAVGERKVILRDGATFSLLRVESLIAHEIETHAITAENGKVQPYELFRRGFAGYIDTQEGLAIWNQNRVLPIGHEKRIQHAKNVLGVAFAKHHSFAALRKYLERELHMPPRRALHKAIDMKRGLADTKESGCFSKALVYFRGYRAIESFVQKGGDLRRLYIGKISLVDLPVIESIKNLRAPVILPYFLRVEPFQSQKKRRKA